MNERSTRSEPLSPQTTRFLAIALVCTAGFLGVSWAKSFQEVPETASPTELAGTGYRVTVSQLAPNVLRVEGFNRFPAASPYAGAQRGVERVLKLCGPVLASEDSGAGGEVPNHVRYVTVPDARRCFPPVR